MKELSVFTGAGGGLLASNILGFSHCGYIENNEYCQKIIAQRIKEGFINDAPIFGDIEMFISDGYAESYKGLVDVLSAGFPCQPFSAAGLRKGEKDKRNKWPETKECIRIIRPRCALLENVPQLCSTDYFSEILKDLAEIWYSAIWGVFSACMFGASHTHDADCSFWPTPMAGCGLRGWGMSKTGRFRYRKEVTNRCLKIGPGPSPKMQEAIMGWPIGWTDLKPLGMDKYQSWFQMFGAY